MKYFFHIFSLLVLVSAQQMAQAAESTPPGYLPIERRMLFNKWEEISPETGNTVVNDYGEYYGGWTHEGGRPDPYIPANRPLLNGYNHHHSSGWSVIQGRTGTSKLLGRKILPTEYTFTSESMANVTNWQVNLQNVIGAQIVSPILNDGIGFLYFDVVAVNEYHPVTLKISYATNRVSAANSSVKYLLDSTSGEEEWHEIETQTVADLIRYQKNLQIHTPVRIKWERMDFVEGAKRDFYFLVIDNICMSYPQSPIKLDTPTATRIPGKIASAKISCLLTDGEGQSPSDCTVKLYYKGNDGVEQTADMVYTPGMGNDPGTYDVVIPLPDGKDSKTLTYRCEAEGKGSYQPIDYTQQGYQYWPETNGIEPGPSAQSDEVTIDVSEWNDSMASSILPIERKLLFNKYEEKGQIVDYGDYDSKDWEHSADKPNPYVPINRPLLKGSEHHHSSGWDLTFIRTGSPSLKTAFVPPENYLLDGVKTINNQASFENNTNAVISSPFYTNGIGYIYFDAVAADAMEPEVKFDVLIATNMVNVGYGGSYSTPTNIIFDHELAITNHPGEEEEQIFDFRYNWVTNQTLIFNGEDHELKRIQIPLNHRGGIRFKIVRATCSPGVKPAFAMFAMDNFQISPPASDVVIRHDPLPFDPAYPGVGDQMKIRCRIDNLDQNVPTTHDKRFVTVYYRWRYLNQQVDDWKSVEMVYDPKGGDDGKGNNELWVAPLPEQVREGDLEYYFVCNFDGYRYRPKDYTQRGHLYWQNGKEDGTECLSPRQFGKAGKDNEKSEFSRRIRLARSKYSKLYLNAKDEKGQIKEPIEMRLIEDNVWWGWVPLNIGRIKADPNMKFSFNIMGVGKYDAKTQSILSETNWWSEVNAATAIPPSGGICQEITDTNSVITVFADPVARYILIKFDMNNMSYTICRADFQDFNNWVMNENVFSDSGENGQGKGGQTKKLDFRLNFNDWKLSEDTIIEQYLDSVIDPKKDPFEKFCPIFDSFSPKLTGRNATYVKTREPATGKNRPVSANNYPRNVAFRLMGRDSWYLPENIDLMGLGSLTTTGETLTDGLKEISFKAALGQSFCPSRILRYTGGYGKKNYSVKANISFQEVTQSEFSFSLIALYQNEENFLEFRVVQRYDEWSNNSRIRLGLLHWQGGKVIASKFDNFNNVSLALKAGSNWMELKIGTEKSAKVVEGNFHGHSISMDNLGVANTAGTFGFLPVNCQARISSIELTENKKATPITTDPANWDTARNNYQLRSRDIISKVPTQRLGLYFLKTDFPANESDATYLPNPTSDLSQWELLHTFDITRFSDVLFRFTPKECQAGFLRLQLMNDGSDVVLDELTVSSWHGKTFSEKVGDDGEWRLQQGWVAQGSYASGNYVELDASRALVDEKTWDTPEGQHQGVESCWMTNGCGSLEFDYRVVRAPAKLTVQFAPESGGSWEDIGSMIIPTAMTTWKHASFYAGKAGRDNAGKLRVVNDLRGGVDNSEKIYTDSWVDIDNMVAWDEPLIDSSSWKIYNGKITAKDEDRVILDETRALFLNNSETENAEPVQDQSDPYLKAPLLLGGVGELSFDARTYNAEDQSVVIHVYLTKGDWDGPDEEWKQFAEITVDTNFYKRYVLQIGQGGEEYNGIKLLTHNLDGKRVCIENVSISEPIYPGFDIVNTRPICRADDENYRLGPKQQPLNTDEIGIEARLSNMRMFPTNIEVFVDFYVGTNVWGISNWNKPGVRKQTRKMVQSKTDPQIYRTEVGNDLGIFDQGEVVQYSVWATCTNPEAEDKKYTITQKRREYKNIPWYEPVDLNKTLGTSDSWSPYFMVYSIPIGTIFINEVNLVEDFDVRDDPENRKYYFPYVEIAVPATVSLKDWQLSFIRDGYGAETRDVTNTIYLTNVKKTAVTNGYAFYVVGESKEHFTDWDGNPIPFPSFIDFQDPELSSTESAYIYPHLKCYGGYAGILLRRPMGMIEQAISYNSLNQDEEEEAKAWAYEKGKMPLCFIGTDAEQDENEKVVTGSLSVIAGNGDKSENWKPQVPWTPGLPNVGQVLPDIPVIFPGFSNVWVTAYLSDYTYASQNGSNKRLQFRVKRGDSTNIIYQVSNWCRVVGVTTNNVDAMDPQQVDVNPYVLQLDNVQTNMEIFAEIGYSPSVPWDELEPVVAEWLRSWPDAPLQPSSYNSKPMTITELYWFDLDPTKPHDIVGKILGWDIDSDTNIFVNAYLSIDGQKCTGLQPTPYQGSPHGAYFKIRAKDDLSKKYYDYDEGGHPFGSGWKFLRQYYIDENSFSDDCSCRIFLPNPYLYNLKDEKDWKKDSLFLRWEIDFDQMSEAPARMTNCPPATVSDPTPPLTK